MAHQQDWIKCVRSGIEGEGKAICGRDVMLSWAFTDPTHAFLNARNGGRLVACPDCAGKIIEQFQEQIATVGEGG